MLPRDWQPDSSIRSWALSLYDRYIAPHSHILFGGSFTKDGRRAFLVRAHALDLDDVIAIAQCARQGKLRVMLSPSGCVHILFHE